MTRLVPRWSRIVLGSTLLAVAAPAGGDAPSARFRLLETPVERPSEGAIEWSRIGVAGAPLTPKTEVLDLELPGGVHHTALRSRVHERRTGDFAWHGRIAGYGDDYQVLLTVSRGYVVGLIDAPEGAYEVTTTSDGGQVAMLLDQGLLPPCAGELEPEGGPEPDHPPASWTAPGRAAGDAVDEIQVMSLYTPQARNAAGGTAAIEATIQAAVDSANQVFANSAMPARYHLAYTGLASRNDSGDLSSDLVWLREDPDVAALRDLYFADMVSLIVADGGGSCGIGYVIAEGFEPADFGPWAFQVTQRSCAVGNHSYAHEHGHNLGMQHNPENASSGAPLHPWSHGHYHDGQYRTVMSYVDPCSSGCPRRGYFSNPDVLHMGLPTGIPEQRDNHRTGNTTAPFAANWRQGVVGPHDDAAYVLTSPPVPSTMYAGQLVNVSMRMRNTGTTAWTPEAGYKLGSQSPQDNQHWGFGRLHLSGAIAPGQEALFGAVFTAPSTPGTYAFHWRMLREGVHWFGATTPYLEVTVQQDNAAFLWQSVPSTMVPGQPYNVSVRMRNTGSTTWPAGGSIRLGSQNPQDNQTWGLHRVLLPATVPPGGWVTFQFTVVAPSVPGTYNFRWRMLRESVAWFGALTPNVAVSVQPPQPPAAPSNLVAAYDAPAARIQLNWTDNSHNEDGFEVQFSYGGSPWSNPTPPTVPANVTTWQSAPDPPSGSYQFRVRAFRAGLSSSWSNVAPVTAFPVPPVDDASFVWQSVPGVMNAGQQYVASVTMHNTGTTTWTAAANHRLGSQNPQDNHTWGLGRVLLPWSVPPGGQVTFSFFVNAPATPGNHDFQWRMLREGVAWFGASTPNVVVVVQ